MYTISKFRASFRHFLIKFSSLCTYKYAVDVGTLIYTRHSVRLEYEKMIFHSVADSMRKIENFKSNGNFLLYTVFRHMGCLLRATFIHT